MDAQQDGTVVDLLHASRSIQTKLEIGQPGDRFEKEADRVADHILQMPDPDGKNRTVKPFGSCVSGHDDAAIVRSSNHHVHKLPDIQCVLNVLNEEEQEEQQEQEIVYTKTEGNYATRLTSEVAAQIQRIRRGGGRSLPGAERAFFEPRFGRDFSGVRIHTGSKAAQVSRAIHARAFTVGRDVVFGDGEYAPSTTAGRRLLGHELTHVVQQNACGLTTAQTVLDAEIIQRDVLPTRQIRTDIEEGKTTHTDLLSWIQILGEQTGHIAHAADFPGARALTNMPSPVPTPDAQPVPTVTRWPIEAYFFPAHVQHTDQRALIMGGFHGDERPGYEMVEAFMTQVRGGQVPLAFHTLIIPRVNRGAVEDNLAGVTWYDRRCNRQFVDLNRNYRVPGAPTPSASSRCPNTRRAPIQPETQGVINIVRDFQPHRILTGHAVSRPGRAGVFADPNTHPTASQLALAMANRLPGTIRQANRLGTRSPTAVYPGDRPGQMPNDPTFGRWAPSASRPGYLTPVITVEAPTYGSLAATGARSTTSYVQALSGFVAAPGTLADADSQIVRDIQAMTIANQRLFLTGRLASTNAIYNRIQARINNAVRLLNGLRPRRPVAVRIVSGRRMFDTRVGGASPQAQIVFEKFTLTGSRANGWDTLPDRYFVGGNRSSGVDRAAWLGESSARRLEIILRFSAIPGASRHHWGTEVDFNSTTNAHWAPSPGAGRPAGRLHSLGVWLEQNAPRVGFFRTYTAGRTGGHAPEPWHYSYEPIARSLREAYNREVRLSQDIVDPIMADWQSRAAVARATLPGDLRPALLALDLSQFVNRIGPGL